MKLIWFIIVVGISISLVSGFTEHEEFQTNSTRTLARKKRYLIFRNLSRGFMRVNVKDRMIDSTNIWAHAVGYRWNVEYSNPPGLKITKRDVHRTLGEMIQMHDFDGRACILRTICELSNNITPNSGIIFKLFKKIFSVPEATDDTSTGSSSLPQGDETYFPYLTSDDCVELDRHCPISQLEILENKNSV